MAKTFRYIARFEDRTGFFPKAESRELQAQHDTHARRIAEGIARRNRWRLVSIGKAS